METLLVMAFEQISFERADEENTQETNWKMKFRFKPDDLADAVREGDT